LEAPNPGLCTCKLLAATLVASCLASLGRLQAAQARESRELCVSWNGSRSWASVEQTQVVLPQIHCRLSKDKTDILMHFDFMGMRPHHTRKSAFYRNGTGRDTFPSGLRGPSAGEASSQVRRYMLNLKNASTIVFTEGRIITSLRIPSHLELSYGIRIVFHGHGTRRIEKMVDF